MMPSLILCCLRIQFKGYIKVLTKDRAATISVGTGRNPMLVITIAV